MDSSLASRIDSRLIPHFRKPKKLMRYWGCLSTLTLLILTLSRMTLSKVSFSDIFRNDYLDHFDTFGENDFDTFKKDTFESVWVDRHPLCLKMLPWKFCSQKCNFEKGDTRFF